MCLRDKHDDVSAAAPVIKWVGGKTRLLAELRMRMPKTYERYFEPFAGGASLFFALAPKRAVLGDMNESLIEMYGVLRDRVDVLISRLEHHRTANSEVHYYATRTWWNEARSKAAAVERAAAFIYMNKTCYNGLWRVNRKGRFNVPRGKYKNPKIFDVEDLRAASAALRHAQVTCGEFDVTSGDATKGDFVYFDPPYDPVSKTSNFTSYTKDAFGKDEQRHLANHARDLRERGVHVMLSNNDTPYIRELYQGFRIDVVQCSRSVNSKADERGAVDEVIITGAT